MEHLVELMEDHSADHFVMARDCDVFSERKDTIKWINSTGTAYTIHFHESPLQGNDFVVPAHGEVRSALKPMVVPGTYAYLIRTAAKEMAADPNVIVH
jgi:hypothetical protein